MKALTKTLVAALGFGVVVGEAGAAIVTQWDFDLSSIWTAASFNQSDGTQQGLTASQLSWGAPLLANRSTLTIGSTPSTGSIDTLIGGGLPVPPFIGAGNSIIHANRVIPSAAPDLNTATLQATLQLDPTAPPAGGQFALPALNFDIRFSETPNSGTCAIPTSPTPCNDIFVLLGGLLNQSFVYDTDGIGGDAPVTYFVNIFPTSGGVLNILPNAACAAAGAPNNCLGFSTPENATTTLAFGFTISTERLTVPEPGSLLLLGAALLGAGFFRTRRKA
jgi:hypothetical protein